MNILEEINKTFVLDSNSKKILREFESECYKIHDDVNQKYDSNPYSLHLKMVVNMLQIVFKDAWKYNFIKSDSLLNDYLKCHYAALLHDAIEDARLTYNDVKRLVSSNNSFYFVEYDKEKDHANHHIFRINEEDVADIVYAVTNEKGKNRLERANEKYYQGIRENNLAVIVKICDRLANAFYSKMMGSRMVDVYKSEHQHFMDSIFEDTHSEFYKQIDLHFIKIFNRELI